VEGVYLTMVYQISTLCSVGCQALVMALCSRVRRETETNITENQSRDLPNTNQDANHSI